MRELWLLILFLASNPIIVSCRPTLGICLLAKDESTADLLEWIEYHQAVGVSGVIVMDNNSSQPLIDLLLPYARSGFVAGYQFRSRARRQTGANVLFQYKQCLRQYSTEFTHLAFLDSDEFLVVKDRTNVIDALEAYTDYGGLVINSVLFGSSGHTTRPPGGVLANYNKCTRSCLVKTIVSTSGVRGMGDNTNHFHWQPGQHAVDTNHTIFKGGTNPPDAAGRNSCNDAPEELFSVLYFHHYATKSRGEFQRRSVRGEGPTMLYFNQVERVAINTCEVLHIPSSSTTTEVEVMEESTSF